MNAPRPGWHPDPTDRHDYRYWDGSEWTDDVSDGGLTALDPVPSAEPTIGAGYRGPEATGYGPATGGYQGYRQDEPTQHTGGFGGYTGYRQDEPTQHTGGYGGYQQDEATQHTGGFGGYTGYRQDEPTQYAGGYGGYQQDEATVAWSDDDRYAYRDPGYRSSDSGVAPGKRGPSRTLVTGVGLVAVALIVGLTIVLTKGDGGGETADGTEISDEHDRQGGSEDGGSTETSDTTATTAAPGTTAPGAPGGSTTTTAAPPSTAPGGEGGEGGGGGGEGGSPEETAATIAQALKDQSGGSLSDEQAQCMAEGMVDTIGPEAAADLAAGGQPDPSTMNQADMMALQQAMAGCGMGPGGPPPSG